MSAQHRSGDPTSALAEIERWGAATAVAAAVDASGAVQHHGDVQRVLPVASLTKLATSLAVLVAVEEGSVALDEPAGPPGATVSHLLCHASGLDFDSERILAQPGERRIYSNTGYEQLAEHLEQRTGLRFAQYLHEGVLAPLGMTSSSLQGSPAKDLHSCVTDLLALAAAWRTPTLVHASTLSAATAAVLPELAGVLPGWGRQDPCWWGLGPELRGDKSPHWMGATASPTTFGHFGGSGTMLWIDPVAQLSCIALSDRTFGDWALDLWPAFSDGVRAAYA